MDYLLSKLVLGKLSWSGLGGSLLQTQFQRFLGVELLLFLL